MGPHDEATLSEAERAALAGLESKAEADDPKLAAALRGHGAKSVLASLPAVRVPAVVVHAARTWLGPFLVVVGLVVMVLSLSSQVALAAVGALVFMLGALLSVEVVRASGRYVKPGSPSTPNRPRSGDGDPTGV